MKQGLLLGLALVMMSLPANADRDLYSGRHAHSGVSSARKSHSGASRGSIHTKGSAKASSAAVQLGQLERQMTKAQTDADRGTPKAGAEISSGSGPKTKSISFTAHSRRNKAGSGRGRARKGSSLHHRGR
jgi:hypothetical protein